MSRTIHIITDQEDIWDTETISEIWGLDNYASILMFLEYHDISLKDRKFIWVELFNLKGESIANVEYDPY